MGCSSSKSIKLNNEDLDFLIRNTSYNEKTIKEWYHGFLQDSPDGKLDRTKFVQMYQMFFTKGNPEEFCDHVFRTFDVDGNGHVDFKEFLLAVGITNNGTKEEKLKWAFRMYDINNDGSIQQPEMTKIVKALYNMIGSSVSDKPTDTPEERTQMIFEKMDADKDGKISLREFLTGCTEDANLALLLTSTLPPAESS